MHTPSWITKREASPIDWDGSILPVELLEAGGGTARSYEGALPGSGIPKFRLAGFGDRRQ